MPIVKHQSLVVRNGRGSLLTTTLCGRLRTVSDGMNIAGEGDKVTCKFCLKIAAFPGHFRHKLADGSRAQGV